MKYNKDFIFPLIIENKSNCRMFLNIVWQNRFTMIEFGVLKYFQHDPLHKSGQNTNHQIFGEMSSSST